MNGKRINPRKRPATLADVNKAKRDAQDEAVNLAIALFLTVMVDKFGYDAESLQKVWNEVNSLSSSVAKGYVNIYDLKQVLLEEYGIGIS